MFNFLNKTAFVLGGSGLIGSKVTEKLIKLNCKVINLDIRKFNFQQNKNYSFSKFNCAKKNLDKDYAKIIKKYGLPDIFINCSYPKTSDWKKNNFKNISYESLRKNIEIQLVNQSFLIKEVAQQNKKKKKKM